MKIGGGHDRRLGRTLSRQAQATSVIPEGAAHGINSPARTDSRVRQNARGVPSDPCAWLASAWPSENRQLRDACVDSPLVCTRIAVSGNYKGRHHHGFKRRCRVVAQHSQHSASQHRWPGFDPQAGEFQVLKATPKVVRQRWIPLQKRRSRSKSSAAIRE